MTTITQHGPIDPLQSAYKAARIVAGELDAGLKRQEPNDNADSGESTFVERAMLSLMIAEPSVVLPCL